ncbi:uncharacterized protein ACLA_089070 [Aspergillus clavatus NRRL 1]|uniref:Uncharacterized protein n=1 Tax=Aspergillus clavatus (strain ATCC 1007 / CBS 513.65 / DSM 816 / NCTC 3887 / NRRL 1 / QM 1276 / 107) TaxID=344612 RepID=A1CEB6_ASPCL|nr:uncharacterized protein ACLA_089070 [Aspergillus clavatus NRRL 1]EAW11215.1 hypothetical protein ACLA_089070 [Aspergillus clavatus NRRL 1]
MVHLEMHNSLSLGRFRVESYAFALVAADRSSTVPSILNHGCPKECQFSGESGGESVSGLAKTPTRINVSGMIGFWMLTYRGPISVALSVK